MKRFSLRAAVIGLAGLAAGFAAVAPALAQSAQCDAWRGELARIERGGGQGADPRAAREAQRVAAEMGRLQGAFSAMQCDGAWIFQAPPAECGAIRGRLGQLRATYASLQQQAGGSENRRRALMAAINDNCRAGVFSTQPIPPQPVQPQGPRTLFEALFGVQPTAPHQAPHMEELDERPREDTPREARWGSGRPVCVRTCDGFFFPLSNSPGGRDGAEDMCQALCPAAETQVFYMPGDGNIEGAVGRRGASYASLPNAGRYLRQFDASCSCRKPGQSWAQALSEAEEMIDRRRGDILVTAQRAEEMSRPRAPDARQRRTEEQLRQRTTAALQQAAAQDAAEQRAIDQQGRQAPTAGTESSGIAGGAAEGRTLGAGQGERREITTPDGERRTVRVVAPGLAQTVR
jgi:hypothetical protein